MLLRLVPRSNSILINVMRTSLFLSSITDETRGPVCLHTSTRRWYLGKICRKLVVSRDYCSLESGVDDEI